MEDAGRRRGGSAWYRRSSPPWLALVLAALLTVGVLALRLSQGDPRAATLVLLVAPIALCAIAFGVLGGASAGIVAVGLVLGVETLSHDGVGALGIATRSTAFLIVGGLLGGYVDKRRALEREINRYYDLSLDLFCSADFDGYFTRLNPAWERTLGHSPARLTSCPFIEFVHPDDRAATIAETDKLADGADSIRFRNRYRHADGRYLWLEWSARAAPDEGRIYATARDVTAQHRAEQALSDQSGRLERMVRERTDALQDSRLETLKRLALAAEYRDDDTHQHTERVGRTAAALARGLGFSDELASLIRNAAALHDVGKLGVPDAILLKPGRLTPAEFRLMQQHVAVGATILADSSFAVVQMAAEIALTHHERWDGTGYLRGLSRDQIPISGRIVAVADVFDALTHARPYKEPWGIERAVAEIVSHGGSHFDPRVVKVFATLDHERLVHPVEQYDLDLPPPPLIAPAGGFDAVLRELTAVG